MQEELLDIVGDDDLYELLVLSRDIDTRDMLRPLVDEVLAATPRACWDRHRPLIRALDEFDAHVDVVRTTPDPALRRALEGREDSVNRDLRELESYLLAVLMGAAGVPDDQLFATCNELCFGVLTPKLMRELVQSALSFVVASWIGFDVLRRPETLPEAKVTELLGAWESHARSLVSAAEVLASPWASRGVYSRYRARNSWREWNEEDLAQEMAAARMLMQPRG